MRIKRHNIDKKVKIEFQIRRKEKKNDEKKNEKKKGREIANNQ